MLSQLTVDPYLNATGGHTLEPGFGLASGEGFADPKLPLPKAGFDLHEGKLEAPAVHGLRDRGVSFASSSVSNF